MSISVNPSALKASVVNLSIVSKHTEANCGSSNRRACVNNKKALSLVKLVFKKSTQCFSKADTAYFFAVYSVVITVSGSICISSVYKKSSTARNATGSTSGTSISEEAVASVPLNIASNTALPQDKTSLWAGIRCCCAPLPTRKVTSDNISLLKRNAILSRIVAFVPCQLYMTVGYWSCACEFSKAMLFCGRTSRYDVFAALVGGRLKDSKVELKYLVLVFPEREI